MYVGSGAIPLSPFLFNLRAHKQRRRRLRPMASASAGYDRLSELRAFDDTEAGVKGLVDAGVSTVPRIFHYPAAPGTSSTEPPSPRHDYRVVPIIDLADTERSHHVSQVKAAAETVGFFQVVNHGVPVDLLGETLACIRNFHEEPAEAKRPYYSRDPARRVRYHYQRSRATSTSSTRRWRAGATRSSWRRKPRRRRPRPRAEASPEYTMQVRGLGSTLLELLSEALGLQGGYLERDADCLAGLAVSGHYYPPCPEPHLTIGTARHSDPSFLTVLLQDGVGGLQTMKEFLGYFMNKGLDGRSALDHFRL
ncbi:hypothetical protein EJB05_12656, partial [Eragrostis curvula]